MSLQTFTTKLSEALSTRKVEVYLPIAKQRVTISPMTVLDDVNLRTRLTRLQEQFKALLAIIFERSVFDPPYQNFNDFVSSITSFDTEVLTWGLYKATYRKFRDFNLVCEHCDNIMTRDVDPDELLHEDSFKAWDREVPFTEFVHRVEIPLTSNLTLVAGIQLPSMRRIIRVLDMIPEERAARYLENLGISMTEYEFLLMCLKELSLKENGEFIASVDNLQEIQILLNTHIDADVKDKILDEYNKVFAEYTPKFYVVQTCSKCGKQFKTEVPSIMTLFFLRLVQ